MRKTFVASFLVASMIFSAGCQNLGISKEQAGTVMGGLGGALIGSQMGGGKGKILATVLMAGAGAYIGNRIGNMLDEKDKQALAQQTQDVLNQNSTSSKPIAWESTHSGATAEISQGKAFEQTKQIDVKRVATVQAVPNMKLIQAPYVTLKSANVRSAPSINGDKVGGLQAGTEFTAVGSTGDWILVGRKGVTVGYINKTLVSPKQEAVAKAVKTSVNLDDMNVTGSSETRGFDLDSVPTASTNVAAATTCRPVSISLTSSSGQAEQENSTYCKQGNGTWELI